MAKRARLNLSLLLPGMHDERDACIRQLESLLAKQPGIARAHVQDEPAGGVWLCLHYDPTVLALSDVKRLAAVAGARVTEDIGHVSLPIRAVSSEDGGGRIEARLLAVPGVLRASVSVPAQRARVEFMRAVVDEERIRATIAGLGHGAGIASPSRFAWYERNRELAWSLVCGGLLLAAWAGEHWFGLTSGVAMPLYVTAYAFGGFDTVRHWLRSTNGKRISLDIDFLMLVAAAGAAVLGEWAEGAFLLFLFSFAHALEHYALGRARNAIRALGQLAPAEARVLRGGADELVAVESVRSGDVVLVRPGERVPVDGVVREGRSAVNQAPITGESVPVDKEPGAEVFAGTVNGDGALKVETTRAVGDRTLDRVMKLVEEAQTQKAPTQLFTERFERVFVPTVLFADLLLIVVPPLLGFWTWSLSFYRGMALLVASSPCALALGTPAAVLAGIAQAARQGVLIKGGAHLEQLGVVRALALDKTGTLTEGKPRVISVLPYEDVSEEHLIAIAAAVERQSQHPLADAVVRRAKEMSLPLPAAGELESVTARGVRSQVDGDIVAIGNLRLWEDEGTEIPHEIRSGVDRLQDAGESVMTVRHGARWLGVIGLADRPRVGVRPILRRLHEQGIRRIVMLTGDNRGVAEAIAAELGVDDVRSDLMPEDKVVAIRELMSQYGAVAMVGDGVNDAPALANATVGIAMGGAGTAAALETADIALMADDLSRLPFAVGLSRKARSVIRQNLAMALAVIALLMLATTTGVFGIGPAVIVHEGSTLLVVGNALRLLNFKI